MAKAAATPYTVALKQGGKVVKEIPCTSPFEAIDQAGVAVRCSTGGESVEILNNTETRAQMWGDS